VVYRDLNATQIPPINAERNGHPEPYHVKFWNVESATEKGSARGCLMMCVAPLVNDAEVQRFLQSAVAGGAALVERRLRDGISAGEIPSDFPVAARATQVTDLARGLTMRAQLGMPRKTLLKDAEAAADLVLLPRRWDSRSK
jgi:hypothetical protein